MGKRRDYIIISNSLLEVYVFEGRSSLYEHVTEIAMYRDIDKWIGDADVRLEIANKLRMGHINNSKSGTIKY